MLQKFGMFTGFLEVRAEWEMRKGARFGPFRGRCGCEKRADPGTVPNYTPVWAGCGTGDDGGCGAVSRS